MKIENQNLLLLGIPSLLILAAGILFLRFGDSLLAAAQSGMPETPTGNVGDVEGYAFLFGFIGSGLGQLAALAVQIFAFGLIAYGILLAFFSLLTRFIYRTTPGRLLAYRILVGIDLLFLLLPVPSLVLSFFRSVFSLSPSLTALGFCVLLVLPSVFVIRNTYTGRITPGLPKDEISEKEGRL